MLNGLIRTSQRKRALTLLALSSAQLLGCTAEIADAEDVGEATEGILGGTATYARPEVAQMFPVNLPKCSATLITNTTFITAAHCVNYAATWNASLGDQLKMWRQTADGTIEDTAEQIASVHSYGNDTGPADLAIGFLANTMDLDWTPGAQLGWQRGAYLETHTKMGYGCVNRLITSLGLGTKRYREYQLLPWPSKPGYSCPGDSGGPVFRGRLSDNGDLIHVNSGYQSGSGDDINANVDTPWIEGMMRAVQGGVEIGLDRLGSDYKTFSQTSLKNCRFYCAMYPDCKAFTWVTSSGQCFLKNAVARAVPNPDTVSGLSERTAASFIGTTIYNYNEVNADECQVACSGLSNCNSFTYQNGVCTLRSDGTAANPGCSTCSGRRRKGLEVDINRPGGEKRNLSKPSASACATECSKDPFCVAFTWNPGSNTCYIKDSVAPPEYAPGYVSGIRLGVDFATKRTGTSYRDFSTYGWTECQSTCNSESQCRAWTVDGLIGAQRCYLQKGATAATKSFGKISGLKNMDFF